MDKPKAAAKPQKKKRGVPEGKTITSIYCNDEDLVEIKKRAEALNMSISQYFQNLAKKDIARGNKLEF